MTKIEIDNFYVGRCEEVMKGIDSESIDMVLTSPPYADQRSYGIKNSKIKPDGYVEWFKPMAHQIYRVLKNNGSFILNINDKVVDGFQHLYVLKLVIYLCEELNFHLVRDYIWYNPATPPNVYSRGGYGRTKKSHEYCFWFSKSSEWKFNLDAVRKPYCGDMTKYLNGEGKGERKDNTRPSTHNFNCGKQWTNHGGSDPGSVIEIANTSSNDVFINLCKERGITRPARFPIKLADFFIMSGTIKGDVVLDPFSGSGTTCVSAKNNGRHWIGIDANKDYCELAKLRIELTNEQQ